MDTPETLKNLIRAILSMPLIDVEFRNIIEDRLDVLSFEDLQKLLTILRVNPFFANSLAKNIQKKIAARTTEDVTALIDEEKAMVDKIEHI